MKRRSTVRMGGVVEGDEVSVVAGYKGGPDRIQGRAPRRRRLQGAPWPGHAREGKPPIFGMIERGGEVRIVMLENVQQQTIRPFIEATIEVGIDLGHSVAAGSMSSKPNMSRNLYRPPPWRG